MAALGEVLASDMVTKGDLRETELRLETRIVELKSDLVARLADTKADLMKGLFGAVGLQTVVILGAVVALAHAVH